MATLTVNLLAGPAENELADFALRLGAAALDQGHRFQLFLFGNACALANQDAPWPGDRDMNQELTDFMDAQKLGGRLAELAQRGAEAHTCHTTEYVRGSEGCAYLPGVARGNVGASLMKFLLTSDAALTLG
ncbi:MAG: DsrE family protein [Pseudomonadota bacterium]